MSNPSERKGTATNGRAMKAKGSQFERDVAAYLRANGHQCVERAYGAGRQDDRGDLNGLPRFAGEVKCCRAIDLAGWVAEATTEAGNAGVGVVPVVIAKRRGKPTRESYVVLRLQDFAEMVREEDA